MRDLSTFATAVNPLRPSGMSIMLVCPWRAAMLHMYDYAEDGSRAAADTGSAMHMAAAEMHRGKELAECIKSMGVGLPKYPAADLSDAADMFLKYASDPRNRGVEAVLVEQAVAFSIEAAPEDHTQARIEVTGTLDQVRRTNGRLVAWDIKTSKKDPTDILHAATFQMAAYCVGAAIHLNEPVQPGGIIMPRQYRKDVATSPVFYHFPWRFQDIEHILLAIRHQVAAIRAGRIWHNPSPDCRWCHMRTPDLCLPPLIELRNSIKVSS